MSSAACPECGAALDDLSTFCPECGESTRGRKRGELAGVRIDPERLERSLPDLEAPSGRWGKPSDRPGHEDGDEARESRRSTPDGHRFERSSEPPRAPEAASRDSVESVPPIRSRSVPPPPMLDSEPAPEAPRPRIERSSVAPPPPTADEHVTTHATRPSPVPPAPVAHFEPPPLDAEVVVLYPAPAPEPVHKPRPTPTDTRAVMHARPPVLASEALLRDLAPAKPAPFALRYCAAVIGIAGVALVAIVTGAHGTGVPFSAAFAALALLSLPPMPYAARAFAVMTVAACGLLLSVFSNLGTMHEDSLVLAIAVMLLSTGLFLRAFHRASSLARVLVTLGVLVGATFLQVSGALRHLTMIDTEWQSWAPRVLGLPFGLLLMLALLAFMDARTTAGCGVWATFVLIFHTVYACVQLLLTVWPKGSTDANLTLLSSGALLAGMCIPLFTALLALALAQMIASTMAQNSSTPATLRA